MRGVTFFRRIYLITLEPFDLAAEHMSGRAHFYGVSHTPLQGGGAPVLSNFGGYLLFLRTSFDAELPNLMWEGLVFRGSCSPISVRAGPQRSPILRVPLYVCVHPLS